MKVALTIVSSALPPRYRKEAERRLKATLRDLFREKGEAPPDWVR